MRGRLTQLFRPARLIGLLWASSCYALPQTPTQPETGPGGSNYPYASTRIEKFGSGRETYWIITPADPVPKTAPVVVFLHGWGGMTPDPYGAWLKHIVRKGNIVVFPRYQKNLRDKVANMPGAIMASVKDAWHRLETDGPVRPVKGKMAWVGHSLGGFMAAKLVGQAVKAGLPAPSALMVCHPGGGDRWLGAKADTTVLGEMTGVPKTMLALVVVGDADRVVGTRDAERIARALAHAGVARADFVTVQSDRRGGTKLVANHFAPLAADGSYTQADGRRARRRAARAARRHPPDALDYYGYWKLLDGLLDAAFRGVHADYALGGSEHQRFMGRFSDGVAVQPLLVRPIKPDDTN